MIEDRFALLLEDLSKELGIELKPDENHSCLLNVQDKLKIQLELDPVNENHLVLGSILGELAPGKFREDTLFAAIEANARPYPRVGNFSYSTKLNALVMHEIIDLDHATSKEVLSIFTPFIQKAFAWSRALEQGSIPPALIEADFTDINSESPFGL